MESVKELVDRVVVVVVVIIIIIIIFIIIIRSWSGGMGVENERGDGEADLGQELRRTRG